ncbi:dipeptide epimerase [Thermomonas flagellata]|uniref:dipeptide epimerase n=1 Tax=Thermomonas flagellata TaxID=2888524 RepID=UPI001F050298|nr:dipeptide epimerase [Thermomonas flagellata]
MRLAALELGLLRAPLRVPFRTALRTVEQVEDVVVQLIADDGRVGHGSAPATAAITGETHASIIAAIRDHIAPRLLGRTLDDLRACSTAVQGALAGNGSAKAAVEIALHDLWAQRHGAPLFRLLGGGPTELRTDLTISVNPPERMAADALDALARGFDALKLKVGGDAEADIARVRAIAAAVAGRARLRLDANQAWGAREAIRVVRALEDAGIALDLVEQPVPAHDLDGLAQVTAAVHTPVLADESAFGPREVLELLRRRAADIVNIKLMKAGGIVPALQIADLCAAHGVPCMLGCMLESTIGVTAAAHVAAARAATITRLDLDVPALCRHDPVVGATRFADARILLGDAPGLGIAAIDGLQPLPG